MTLLTNTHAFFKALEAGLREEAALKGLDLVVVACEMNAAKQASQIEDFVARKVSAILAAHPGDSDAIVPALAGAEAADSRCSPPTSRPTAARSCRTWRATTCKAADWPPTRWRPHRRQRQGADHRSPDRRVRSGTRQGLRRGLRKYPGITIVAKPSADGQRAKAAQIMEDMLQAHRDLVGVFGINDDSALGAAGVIEAAGRKDIVVIGYDASDEAQAAIKKGGPLKADVISVSAGHWQDRDRHDCGPHGGRAYRRSRRLTSASGTARASECRCWPRTG